MLALFYEGEAGFMPVELIVPECSPRMNARSNQTKEP